MFNMEVNGDLEIWTQHIVVRGGTATKRTSGMSFNGEMRCLLFDPTTGRFLGLAEVPESLSSSS